MVDNGQIQPYGDACPGAALRFPVENVDELYRELKSRPYMGYFPEVHATPGGAAVICRYWTHLAIE
tara:strand:+ start:620 stop:817 length:198 start_codon:yes stop_codon:yes gene_type:complete